MNMAKRKIKVQKVLNAHIDFISNVSEGDNGIVSSPIWQSKDKVDGDKFLLDTKIIAVDTEKRLVNYVIQEAGVVNFSKRYWTADVLEKCCNQFGIEAGSKGTNRLHYEDKKTGEVRSDPSKALITQNFMLYSQGDPRYPGTKTPAWVQQWYYPQEANDELKEAKIGKVGQVSLQGTGTVEEVEIEIEEEFIKQDKEEDLTEKVGLMEKFLKTIGFGDKKEADQTNTGEEPMNEKQFAEVQSKFDSILEALKTNKSDVDSKVKAVEEKVEQTLQTKVKEMKDSLTEELKIEIKEEVNQKTKLIAQKNSDGNISVGDDDVEELQSVLQKAMGVKVKVKEKK